MSALKITFNNFNKLGEEYFYAKADIGGKTYYWARKTKLKRGLVGEKARWEGEATQALEKIKRKHDRRHRITTPEAG